MALFSPMLRICLWLRLLRLKGHLHRTLHDAEEPAIGAFQNTT